MLGEEGAKAQLSQTADALPVKRIGRPSDITKTVGFLIDNSFVNGTNIVVDGGHRLI